jgi:hypothetical protein
MKKISVLLLSFFLLLGIYTPTLKASADSFCDQYKGVKKILWNGIELKAGQIGRLIILKNTSLFKLDGDKKVLSRTLKTGEVYGIYAFKPGKLSVGGGYYVDRDSTVKYETPSKTKLTAVKCINGNYIGNPPNTTTPDKPKYPRDVDTTEEKGLYDRVMALKLKTLSNGFKTYSDFYNDVEAIQFAFMNVSKSFDAWSSIPEPYDDITRMYGHSGKIVITFSNNEKYLLNDMASVKYFVDNKYYFQFSDLEKIYGVLNNSYYVRVNNNYPANIHGDIYANSSIPDKKIFINPDDINSKYYYEFTMLFKNNVEKKINIYSTTGRYDLYSYPPFSIEDLIEGLGVRAEVSYSPNNVIEIKLLDALPKQF